MENETITAEQVAPLEKLFDGLDGVSIQTDEDYRKMGDLFEEDE